ncbi:MAG: 3-dehydroquinate synthase [Puniceicoccaceae bacterium]|nr:MAG: 3-dehydroquinate synthase [Puniceicoccaceae bacterium]
MGWAAVEPLSLTVSLGERAYPILLGRCVEVALHQRLQELARAERSIAVVTDDRIRKELSGFFGTALRGLAVHEIPAGEASKSGRELGRAWEFFARAGLDRKGVVVAVGGGVVGDLAGFAAATYLRGVDYIQIPTTLLAMVDSSVGGKTGVNLEAGKNLAGAFHQPAAVFIQSRFLESLPKREFGAGMAEVIKYGLLGDERLFRELEDGLDLSPSHPDLPRIIRTCCAMKARIVEADERETSTEGGRALLNLGHTFAHAIENVAGYGSYLHGEAVAVGLVGAGLLSEGLERVPPGLADRVRRVLQAYGLPVRLVEPLPVPALMAAMRKDKKAQGGVPRFIVLKAVGQAALRDGVSEAMVAKIWTELGAGAA